MNDARLRRSAVAALALALAAVLASNPPGRAVEAPPPPRVAIIVGPVGTLSDTYIQIAEMAAAAATQHGAEVARAYTPDATPEHVLAAVEGANVVVYLGHGVGFPNPYASVPNPDTVNGWGLQGPNARGDHADSWRDGTLAYYGEAWLAANARPAPGFVMIYSNACYAPGAGEGAYPVATEEEAVARVSAYSRGPLAELGASAYFATDFYGGAAELIGLILGSPALSHGEIFAGEPRYDASAVTVHSHANIEGAEVRLHRSVYLEGKTDYWYAFAGDPSATPWGAGVIPQHPEWVDPHSY